MIRILPDAGDSDHTFIIDEEIPTKPNKEEQDQVHSF
jgi:hypothetical protein